MTPKLIEDLGSKLSNKGGTRKRKYGLYKCSYCDKEFETLMDSVRTGQTKSCGCLKAKSKITHGLKHHKFYPTWANMIHRCIKPSNSRYKDYGARGITVCEEWLDVTNFVAWCDLTYPNIKGFSLDRIDNDKGYSPENCRWADASTQALNRRLNTHNTSGYVGVGWSKASLNWWASIRVLKKLINIGHFNTIDEAIYARDTYIIQNNLPNKLSTQY